MRTAVQALLFTVVLVSGIGIGFFLVLEFRTAPFDGLRYEFPPCFEVGRPFHHRFLAGCKGTLRTPRGAVPIRINEDGLRDDARATLLSQPRRILVMGDSTIEGWWLAHENSASVRLHARFPDTAFINGGLRSTGPTLQAKRLLGLAATYRPAGILWFLNDTDGFDERLACAAAVDPKAPLATREFDTPELALGAWEQRLVSLLGNGSLGRRTRAIFYEKRWREVASSAKAKECPPCGGVEEMKRAAAGIPMRVFFIPNDDPPLTGIYLGGAALREQTLACLKAAGIAWTEIRPKTAPEERERFYWTGDFHPTPEGLDRMMSQAAPDVADFLKHLPARR